MSVFRSSPFAFAKALFDRHRTLASNAAGLYLETLTSYLFPLITLPYLVRILGPHQYGTLAFAQSLVGSLGVIVDYAGNLTATRKVTELRANPEELAAVTGQVTLARVFLCLPALSLLGILAWFAPPVREALPLLILLAGVFLAQATSPAFLFLGLERMLELARLNFFINCAVVMAIFTLVRSPKDLLVLGGILSAGPLAGSYLGHLWLRQRWGLRPTWPSWRAVRGFLREGFPLFLSTAAMAAYTTANPFLLGLFAKKEAVAFYAGAEKIVRALLRLIAPLTTAFFPRMVEAAQGGTRELYRRAWKVLAAFCVMGASVGLFVAATAPWIVRLFLGAQFAPSVVPLRLLSVIFLLVAASNVLGFHLLLPLRRDALFTAIVVAASLANLTLAAVLAPGFGERGMAIAVVVTELMVTVAMLVAVEKLRPVAEREAWREVNRSS